MGFSTIKQDNDQKVCNMIRGNSFKIDSLIKVVTMLRVERCSQNNHLHLQKM